MTKLDPRVRRTHQALQEAMLSLIQEKPYDAITIQEITERGDLNRATFYLHYSSKEELLADSLEGHFDAVVARIAAEVGERPYWEDATSAQIVFEYVAGNSELYKVLLGEKGLGHVMHRILRYMSAFDEVALARHMPPGTEPVVPIAVLAQQTAGALFALAKWWLENDMPYSAAEMAEMLRRMCALGVRGIMQGGEG
ncbi:MAG: TetR/AcrR family transcriptional regulator [Ardenticatenaceae bacterium]|nr:TetR/AcrR family transcriptional regulator [Ardenticatenaceae bacterium]